MSNKRMVKFYPNNGKPFESVKVDRNAPCECGSGKKQKKCCGDTSKLLVVDTRSKRVRCEDPKAILCDRCIHCYPNCSGKDLLFGDGLGNDNIIACESFECEKDHDLTGLIIDRYEPSRETKGFI